MALAEVGVREQYLRSQECWLPRSMIEFATLSAESQCAANQATEVGHHISEIEALPYCARYFTFFYYNKQTSVTNFQQRSNEKFCLIFPLSNIQPLVLAHVLL